MATSTIRDNAIIKKSYTTVEFTVAAGKMVSVAFDGYSTLNISGYTIIGYFFGNGSTSSIRSNIVAFTLNWEFANIKLLNVSSSSITGTATIVVVYAKNGNVRTA